MKRYRVLSFDMDFRASNLELEINESWETETKILHQRNKENTVKGLINEFGNFNSEAKIQNFIDLGNAPHSIISNHNKFLRQVRNAFIIGSYYPALTGACALGERILNNLLIKLRDYYKSTPEYKNVYRKNSFDNWKVVIDTLAAWKVLLPNAVADFTKLSVIRNKAIHFDPNTDNNDRELSLEAIKILSKIIDEQFTAFGNRPWFISGTLGVCFIKKDAENIPFVKEIYLPNCALVGKHHSLEIRETSEGMFVIVNDEYEYEQKEVSDEEFKKFYSV